MNEIKQFADKNISLPIVVSAALGTIVSGVAVYAMAKSGLKPLKKAAAVAKGGK